MFMKYRCQSTRSVIALPADRLSLVLLVQPLLERGEVVADRRRIHLPLPGQCGEGFWPWAARAHRQHRVQTASGLLVPVDRTAVERTLASGDPRQRAVKLELEDVRQKVAHIRDVAGHVELRAGVEILLVPRHRRRDALVFLPQLPPRLVVFLRRDLSRENLPAPFVDHEPERQEGDLLERLVEEQADVLRRVRRLLQKTELHEVFRRDRERDRIADGFVEAVVGALAEEVRLTVVGALVAVSYTHLTLPTKRIV